MLYRGVDSPDRFSITDPSKAGRRKSFNLPGNEYTLLMDNLPQWKNYPERGMSIICSNNPLSADSYGTLKMMFPKNGAKIGVCDDGDIWFGFKRLKVEMGFDTTPELNTSLGMLLDGHKDKDWATLKKSIEMFDKNYSKWDNIYSPTWEYIIKKKGSLMSALEYLFDPKANKFKLSKSGDTFPSSDHEMWVGGPCISMDMEDDFGVSHSDLRYIRYVLNK